MPRITHVKAAQQRYATVPVLDDNGQPKVVPVTNKRTGEQKVTKSGKPVTMKVTREDRENPKPLLVCDYCNEPIQIGTPYKWIKPSSGPYGGYQRNRHEACPSWQVWEYSSSLSARLAQLDYDNRPAIESAVSNHEPDEVTSALEAYAEEIRGLASEKEEGADNIESGFGHETEKSQELRDIADQLNTWAEEVEQVEVPDAPDPDDADEADLEDCGTCEGKGQVLSEEDADPDSCPDCGGTGKVSPDEPTETQWENWEAEIDLGVLDNCPV